jgi:cyclopropane-fatty-acyl-phospholipid synthase
MSAFFSDQRHLEAVRRLLEHLAAVIDIPFSLRLWDGTMVPLGRDASDSRYLSISGPGVLGSLLCRPSLENLFRHYVSGHIEVHGSDLVHCLDIARTKKKQANIRLADLRRGFPWAQALPLLFARDQEARLGHQVEGAEAGRGRTKLDDKGLIQFHYDTSNAFYAFFLDSEMVYSRGYFTDWSNSLDQAQGDKLDIICRKLRLQPDESFLDIGSGWGALLCHAAQHYGVRALGVTLSQAQFDYATDKIERLGLKNQVTVTLRNYMTLEGSYDKIASIGMYEHVGIANYEAYFKKIRGLLGDRGIFKRKIQRFG